MRTETGVHLPVMRRMIAWSYDSIYPASRRAQKMNADGRQPSLIGNVLGRHQSLFGARSSKPLSALADKRH